MCKSENGKQNSLFRFRLCQNRVLNSAVDIENVPSVLSYQANLCNSTGHANIMLQPNLDTVID